MAMPATQESVQAVLDRVAAVVTESGRKIVENRDVASAVQDLNNCKVNLQRISNRISSITLQTVETAVDELLDIAQQTEHDRSDSHAEPMHTSVEASPDIPSVSQTPRGCDTLICDSNYSTCCICHVCPACCATLCNTVCSRVKKLGFKKANQMGFCFLAFKRGFPE